MFEIQSSIPLPARATRARAYPFAEMNVGDSFFIATADEVEDKRVVSRLAAAVRNYRKSGSGNDAARFAIRARNEGDQAGVRVWRVK